VSFESVSIARLPLWLAGPVGTAYEGALGASEDKTLRLDKEARKLLFARSDCIATTDAQALLHAGELRELPRAPEETGSRYLTRLSRAHEIWYWSGTRAGYLNVFSGLDAVTDPTRINPYHEQVHLDPERDADQIETNRALGYPNPELWLRRVPAYSDFVTVFSNAEAAWDSNEDWYSRVFFHLDSREGPWDLDGVWDSPGEWDDGGLWDTTMTVADFQFIATMLRRMKGLTDYPTAAAVWLPGLPIDGFWCSPGVWDDGFAWEVETDEEPLILLFARTWEDYTFTGQTGDYPLVDLWPAESSESDLPWRGIIDAADLGKS
jgi:hypothetical protein